jgi:hypothetical protein
MTDKSNKIKFISVILLGLLIRILFYLYTVPSITDPAAEYMLAAKNIAHGVIFPVFSDNNLLTGAFPSYILALSNLLIDNAILNVFFIEFLIFILLCLLTYKASKIIYGPEGAIICTFLLSFAPSIVFKTTVFSNGLNNLVFLFTSIMILLTVRITDTHKNKLYAFFGFIAGLAFWTSFYSICFLLPCVFFIFYTTTATKISLKLKQILIIIICFLSGSLPFWWFNIKSGFLTFKNISFGLIEPTIDNNFQNILSFQLINTFSIKTIFSIITLLGLIYYIAFLFFLNVQNKNKFKTRESLFVFFVFISIIIFVRFPAIPPLHTNIFIILYLPYIYILTYFLLTLRKQSSKLFLYIFIGFISLQATEISLSAINDKKQNTKFNAEIKNLMDQLQKENIIYAYTGNDLSHIIKFISNEKINTIIYNYLDRSNTEYFIDTSKPSAVILPIAEGKKFRKDISHICMKYKMININNKYLVFFKFKKPIVNENEIKPLNWSATSNFNNETTNLAFDRNISTRWTTDLLQNKDMYYMLDLKSEYILNKIVFYYGESVHDFPAGLSIEVSKDKKTWKKIVYLYNNHPFIWSGLYLYFCNSVRRQEYYLPPTKARYIKLNQTKSDYPYYWSIHEIEIY